MATHPQRMPFMAEHEVRAIETCLASFRRPIEALEWGAGGSTSYFSAILPARSRWDSIEHHGGWASSVREELAARSRGLVTVHYVPNDAPFRDGVDDGDLTSFRSYVLYAARLGRPFDFILVDGRARVECLRLGWELLTDDGVLVLHDAQRPEYAPGVPAEAHLLRLSQSGAPEGTADLLFAARRPSQLDEIASRLAPRLSPEVRLSRAPDAPAAAAPRAAASGDASPIPELARATAVAASPGAPSCVFVNTYYPEFLRRHYQGQPSLADAPYELQHAALQQRLFGDSDFYSRGLAEAGFRAQDLIVNCGPLQARWAKERGVAAEGLGVAVGQIARARPDVVYLQNLSLATREFVEAIRPHTRLVVGQIASEVPEAADLSLLDLVISSFPHFVREFRARGLAAYYQPLAFEPRVLRALPSAPRDLPLTFVGGLSQAHTWQKGTGLIEALARETPIAVWGYGAEALPIDSAARQRWRGEAWGQEMFALLRRSRITVNRHSEAADRFANNMRLFEATGCGALLVTDHKDNLDGLFTIGEEVVAYRSPEECLALLRYYLAHPDEADAIARAGQARTLREHTYARRMAETAELLEHHLRRKRRRGPRPDDPGPVTTALVPIAAADVSAAMREAWKDPRIPERQRDLVERELADMYRGQVPRPYQAMAESLRPFANRGDSLLEIGCSSGYYHEVLDYLLGCDLDYVGVDFSPAFVELARRIYPRARFEVADGAQLPFPDASFDVAVSSCVLLHVEGWRRHVAEAARVARRYVVAHRTPVRRRETTAFHRKLAYGVETVELRFSEQEMLAEFARHGLRLIRAFELHADPERDEFWVTWVFAKGGSRGFEGPEGASHSWSRTRSW